MISSLASLCRTLCSMNDGFNSETIDRLRTIVQDFKYLFKELFSARSISSNPHLGLSFFENKNYVSPDSFFEKGNYIVCLSILPLLQRKLSKHDNTFGIVSTVVSIFHLEGPSSIRKFNPNIHNHNLKRHSRLRHNTIHHPLIQLPLLHPRPRTPRPLQPQYLHPHPPLPPHFHSPLLRHLSQ